MSGMVITHNLMAENANRMYNIVGVEKKKSTEKLSSGYRINRAADDAAGLSISEKLRWQVRGLNKAAQNISDGISFVQTGEGALNEVHSMLQRIRELAVQASNDTNTDRDRSAINDEVQEIKKEMQRVFDETQFNSKFIFRAPYTPTLENEPQDYAMFNIGDGNQIGGVLINNKRFTWEELGVDAAHDNWETPTDSDRELTFYDKVKNKYGTVEEEKITLRLKAGDSLPNVHRVYEMAADTEGIRINEVLAGKWDVDIEQDGDHYSFSYNGVDISFDADAGADRASVIEHLNPDGFSVNSWDAVPNGSDGWFAVHSEADNSMRLYVTEANKVATLGTAGDIERWMYQVTADDEGVTITQENYTVSDGISHTKTKWKDFKNINASGDDDKYPIVDYGTSSSDANNVYNPVTRSDGTSRPLTDNPITLDNDATYHYSDVTNDPKQPEYIAFDFFMRDEVSKEEAKEGLTQTLVGSGVSAPIASVTDASSTVDVLSSSGITFHFQRDQLLRDFGGDAGGTSPMNVTVVRSEKIDDGQVTDYESRKELKEAYLGWKTVRNEQDYTETGKLYVNADGSGEEFYKTSGTRTAISDGHRTSTAYQFSLYTEQDRTRTDSGSGSIPDEWELVNGEIYTTEEKDGKTYEVYDVTRKVTDWTSQSGYVNELFYESAGGAYSDGSGSYAATASTGSTQYGIVHIATEDISGDVNSLTRDANDDFIRDAAASDTSQHYISTSSVYRANKIYDLSHYEYSMYNSAGTLIMTGKSAQFIDTGAGTSGDPSIEDSAEDIAHDEGIGISRTAAMPAENVTDTITLHNQYGAAVTYTSDLAYRTVTLSGTDDDGRTASVTMGYDDRTNTGGTVNKTENVAFSPDGRAYRDFRKPEQNAGNATEINFKVKLNPPEKVLNIQAGALGQQGIQIRWSALSNSIIGMSTTNTLTYGASQAAIADADEAIDYISTVRSGFGAQQNRLEHAYEIDRNISENTDAAESRIRDTDMAKEMVSYSKHSILEQVGQSMIAQANQSTQGVLNIL